MERDKVFNVIAHAWSAETSASNEWSKENKALGQCAVTACIVQDLFGGDIVNTTATLPDGSIDSHYYNVIEGAEIDLTRSQFPEGTTFSPGVEKKKEFNSTREYVLSYGPTNDRYQLLKNRFIKLYAMFLQDRFD